MHKIKTLAQRELAGYFATPVAYVFLVIFLILTGIMTFFIPPSAGWFERGQADLTPFFAWHPWLYLFLAPAVSMRLWAEERRTGTIELLMTLPVTTWQTVVAKFLAAWLFLGIALALTFPIWISVNYLGDPDNGVILASYVGSFLLAGASLAIGCCMSAITKNQVIAFVLTLVVCFLFILSGLLGARAITWAPASVIDAVQDFSFLTRFGAITNGVITARDMLYFASLIVCFLLANAIIIEVKKAD